jgi:DNA invertase Pin-like site-specific DNA recombinase
MNVGLYLRVSTDDQQSGLQVYIQQAKDFCERYGHTYTEIFIDEDVSGDKDLQKRPAGAKLLAALESGKIQGIVSPNVTRLFRNLRNGVNTIDEFEKRNWRMFVSDGYGLPIDISTIMGFSMFVDQLKYAQIERMQISERTKNGMTYRRNNGKATSHTPYGYERRADDKTLYTNDSEMDVVSIMLEMYSDNIAYLEIAKELNLADIPAKKGGKWTAKTVRGVIQYQNKIMKKAA